MKIHNGGIKDFLGNRVCLILMGEDTTIKKKWRAIHKREFDADLLAGKTFEWEGEPFKQGFDRTLAKSGHDYDGYILLIRNSEGKIVVSSQSKPYWAKDLEKAWGLQEGKDYDKDFFEK